MDKAYIVANEQQEREVLEKLEREGFTWWGGDNLTENTPSKLFHTKFPYTIFVGKNTVTFNRLSKLEDEEIVYDGRKENKMKISEEVYDALVDWRDNHELQTTFISGSDLFHFPNKIVGWLKDTNTLFDNRNRLIAIIRWVNGEDVFEVEKPKKWIVRSKLKDDDGDYWYVSNYKGLTDRNFYEKYATKFNTKEEAESWANANQEVIEVEA